MYRLRAALVQAGDRMKAQVHDGKTPFVTNTPSVALSAQ